MMASLEYWNKVHADWRKSDNAMAAVRSSGSSFFSFVLPYLPTSGGDNSASAVELGCGRGQDACALASTGLFSKVFAVDASESACAAARAYSMGKGLTGMVQVIEADASRLVPEIGAHTLVFSRFFLHSVSREDQAHILSWAVGALRPGGLLAIEARSINDPRYGKGMQIDFDAFEDTHYRRFLRPRELATAIERLGLSIVSLQEDYTSANIDTDRAVVVRLIARKPSATN